MIFFKVALNPLDRIFLNFTESFIVAFSAIKKGGHQVRF